MPAAPEKLEAVLQNLRLFKAMHPFRGDSPEKARMLLDGFAEPAPRAADVREIVIDGDHGRVTAEWITTAATDPKRRLVYLHGGAYIAGSRTSHRALVARLADACCAAALSVDYRLAPEHPFPAGLDDAKAAVAYAARRGPWDEDVGAETLVVAGDSAGGGLALKTMIAARDEHGPRIDGGVLISPWTDLSGSGESVRTNEERDPMLSGRDMGRAIGAYVRNIDPRDPRVSPLFADLSGLPPLLVHVGSDEILLDDSTRLAERARKAGVDVTFHLYEDLFHVFHVFASKLPEAREAIDEIGAWVRAK